MNDMLINITAYCSEKYKKVNRMDEKMKKTKIKFCPAQGKWDTEKGKWNPLEYGSFWMLIPVAAGVYLLSLLTAMLLKLIPGLRKLL